MISEKDLQNLADLSRLTLTDEELHKFGEDISNVLSYLDELEGVEGTDAEHHVGDVKNVMREDDSPHEPGQYTDDIIANAPEHENSHIKVNKILSQE